MNWQAIKTIYFFEMNRFFRTFKQSFLSPVLSTSLYFVVFGAALGSRIEQLEGVSYGAFLVPGLVMLGVITQATSNAAFGIHLPKYTGTIYELLSAPITTFEIILGYVGAASSKALFIGVVILATSAVFIDLTISHPLAMMSLLLLTCISFALFGFIIGIWATSFEQVQTIPLLVITP
ncbi:MAG: ABC transporter permease, partial [Rhodobacterales bacterium]